MKVADFGTVRDGPARASGDTHVSTARAAGTRAYMPPEYADEGQFSEKTDSCKWVGRSSQTAAVEGPQDEGLFSSARRRTAAGVQCSMRAVCSAVSTPRRDGQL